MRWTSLPAVWKLTFPAGGVCFKTMVMVKFADQSVMLRTNALGFLSYSAAVGGNWFPSGMSGGTHSLVLGHLSLLTLPLWPFTLSPLAWSLGSGVLSHRHRVPPNGFEILLREYKRV
jgi:hypothetical protein